MAGRKPGRPSKGPRKRVELKVPLGLAELLDERTAGRDRSDWVVELIAERLGYTLPGQERLPLSDVA